MLAATMLLAACGDDDGDGGGGSGEAPKLALLYTIYSDFQTAQEEGISEVIDPLGGSYERFNANFNPQMQIAQCKDAVNSGRFNAIVLQVLDPPTGVPCAQAANEAGIPVIANDTPIGTDANDTEPQVDGVVGGVYITPEDNASSVVEMTKLACEGLNPCNIIAEKASPTDPLTNDPIDAVKEEVPNAEIVGEMVTGYDPGAAAQQMPDLLAANPDANVYLSISDGTALASVPAIDDAGLLGKIRIIGAGGSRQGAKAIADGTLFVTNGNWPKQEGEFMANMAVQAINGDDIDPVFLLQNDVDEPAIITKDNVNEFTPEWGAGG
jgi:ribose transport system substrate-binding protein